MLILWILQAWIWTDPQVLVLKNGQTISLVEPYAVEGQTVQFKDKNGNLMMLPLKMVNLEETERRNAPKEEPPPAPEPEPRDPFEDYVDQHTETMSSSNLTDETLDDFAAQNPRAQNDAVPWKSERPRRPKGQPSKAYLESLRNYYELRVKYLRKEIDAKKERIQTLKRANSNLYTLQELANRDDQVKYLQKEVKALEKRLLDIKNEARKKGLKVREY